MRLRLGYEFIYDFVNPTPVIALLNVHFSRAGDLESPDHLIARPTVAVDSYRDTFGNWCCRFVAPAGRFVMTADAVIHDEGRHDPTDLSAIQHPIEALPSDTLLFLLGSRYCETDLLSEEAWNLFGHLPPGWSLVQSICDYVHEHITFDYEQARSTRTARDALADGCGVCRDFAHLAITFCRCVNIPARYCTGYTSDIGTPQPWGVGDFAAWMEVFLGGRWHIFDPRNNTRRIGRALIARGRDAADVPLTHTFGPNNLVSFRVWTDKIS